jgi:hypothetical protein
MARLQRTEVAQAARPALPAAMARHATRPESNRCTNALSDAGPPWIGAGVWIARLRKDAPHKTATSSKNYLRAAPEAIGQ